MYALLNLAEDSAVFDNCNVHFFLTHQVHTATAPGMDGCAGMTRRLEPSPSSTAQIIFLSLIQQVEYLFLFYILCVAFRISMVKKRKSDIKYIYPTILYTF